MEHAPIASHWVTAYLTFAKKMFSNGLCTACCVPGNCMLAEFCFAWNQCFKEQDNSVSETNFLRFFCLDTFVERNTLMERVYPRLKSYCQERGYDFQVVDMRWGVRDESTDDHMTTELCMRELRACQKLSTGPNFIVSSI